MPRVVPQNPPGTNGLKRHPALVALSRDHHGALMQALWLRRAAQVSNVAAAAPVAEEFLAFYTNELLGHFADEEEVLLPVAAHADPEGADRIRSEHAELHAWTARLREALAAGTDARTAAGHLGQLLDDHVRFEERSFFMAVQAVLSDTELSGLERAMNEHREARGAVPGCALPPR